MGAALSWAGTDDVVSEVLFGHSFFLRHDPKSWAAMEPYPPLGTLYAAASVRAAGHTVALFDAMLAESEDGWALALDHERPRFAVIFEDSFHYLTKMCLLRMREAAFLMIRMARERGCTVIVSGSDATDRAEAYLSAGADYVIMGEGELTLLDLLRHLTTEPVCSPGHIPGLTFLDQGRPTVTPRRPVHGNLDGLPFPAWDLVDLDRYRRVWHERRGFFSLNMATSRGCPYHCNWCAKPIWGQRYNARSPENVVMEMAWLQDHHAPDHIWFTDDIFGLRPGWISRFADLVQQHSGSIPFKCLCRPDLLLRDDRIPALRRAGCEIVWMGAESGSQSVLDAMDKGVRVEALHEATAALHGAGIRVGFFLQFGYPGETRADIEATLRLIRACRPDEIGVSVSYPLPGTRFHERVREELTTGENWHDAHDLSMLYRGPFTTSFYRRLHTLVHREFALSRAWNELRDAARRPGRLRPRHVRMAGGALTRLAGVAADRLRLAVLARSRPNAAQAG